jgi:hypothetical protein
VALFGPSWCRGSNLELRRRLRCNTGMKRLLVLAALLVAAAVSATGAAPKTPVRKPVVASTSIGLTAGLFLADPVTLKPLGGQRLSIPFDWSAYSRSPDGLRLALARPFGGVAFVRLDTVQRAGQVELGRVDVQLLCWLTSRTLLVRAGGSLVAIDARTPRITWRRALGGQLIDWARAGSRTVFLVGPQDGRAAPAQVSVLGARGTLRTTVVERIYAGSESSGGALSIARVPGIAVDASGDRAWVVGAGEPVAEVDLSALTVAYADTRTLAKVLPGPTRHAVALGGGMLAVAGTDATVTMDSAGMLHETVTPSGLTIVDTRSGAARAIQPDASSVLRAGSSLLASGVAWDTAAPAPKGSGLTVYALDGTLRARLFGAAPISDVHVQAGLAYVSLPDRNGHVAVVDTATGRVLKQLYRPTLRVLADD